MIIIDFTKSLFISLNPEHAHYVISVLLNWLRFVFKLKIWPILGYVSWAIEKNMLMSLGSWWYCLTSISLSIFCLVVPSITESGSTDICNCTCGLVYSSLHFTTFSFTYLEVLLFIAYILVFLVDCSFMIIMSMFLVIFVALKSSWQ